MISPEAAAIIDGAAALIRKGWTHTHMARNKSRIPVGPCNDDAVCWCTFGAILAASTRLDASNDARYEAIESIQMAIDPTHVTNIADWNDLLGRLPEDVILVFEKAKKNGRLNIRTGEGGDTALSTL